MASTDILAIDQASVDMVYNLEDSRKNDLIERIESREGLRQLTAMKELGMGSSQYELGAAVAALSQFKDYASLFLICGEQ